MIKTFKNHYLRTPSVAKLFLGIFLFLGVFIATFKFLYADSIPFQDSLSTMFSGWFNSGYYSNTYFRFGGNDFVGIVFWQDIETLSVPQPISINSGAQAIQCTGHLKGIYYNNQRGRRIWPLDTGNLAILSGQGTGGYNTMGLTNGFFTNCSAVSGGYFPAANEVYGQIDHTIGSQTFHMIAGVQYNFTGNVISGSAFGRTLQITGGVHTGFIFDTNGGIAELSMNMPWCQNFISAPSAQPINIALTDSMQFTCYGASVNGYILNIFNASGTLALVYSTGIITTASSWMNDIIGSNLGTGYYKATCTVQGPSGSGPQCGTNILFHVGGTGGITTPSGTGCNTNFQGELTFAPISGALLISIPPVNYYTNKTGIVLKFSATNPVLFSISGDFLLSPFTQSYTGYDIYNHIVTTPSQTLIKNNDWNYISSTYTSGTCAYTDSTKRVYVDTLAPTIPIITLPTTGTNMICPSTPLTLARTASSDSGSQLAYYKYEIYSNSGMTTGIILSGTTTATTTSIIPSSFPLGTYYVRVLATDNVGITSTSSSVTFTTSSQYCAGGTGVMIVTPTIWLRNVNLDTIYKSDPIYILGLTGPTLVTVSKGMLFINNTTGGNGTTGMVSSVDTIYIELVSSNEYDTTTTSELHILGLTGTFSLTTKKSNCILSAGEKLVIQNIYANLKDEYNNDITKLSEFLHTFQSMVQDESDLTNSCTLEYLLQLIEDDLGIEGIDTSNHITPNCKEYSIGYDTTQLAYYAPEMANRYYFINRESLIRHLDYYNPGDCHINTYGTNFRTSDTTDLMKHIAPNGKIYNLIGQYGGFSATEFTTPKYFDSLSTIKMYIDLRNPAKEIWKHTLDIAFIPITYAAPNGREYKIYKTDRGYMSYKLMKVRYYSTIGDLKNYININNPSKR